MICSSGTSMIRPGHFSLAGWCALTMSSTGIFISAGTGMLTDSRRFTPSFEKCALVLSAFSSASSDNLAVAASEALAVNAPAAPCRVAGWRTRA